MIRLLREQDHSTVMEFLGREPELNLFIIGDIANAGYDSEQVRHWGDFDRRGQLVAVLTRYYDSLVFYACAEFALQEFLELIGALEWNFLSGESSILEPLAARIPHGRRRETFMARLGRPAEQIPGPAPLARPATLEDIPGIVRLRQKIEEFEVTPDPAMLYQTFQNREGRAWVIEEQGQIVAVAQSAAESAGLAMVVGVCTHPAWRQHGYASACTARLCRALRAEGKIPCLFYDNPEAGRIYKRLGFEDFARWVMVVR